jgi:hypothetical protein
MKYCQRCGHRVEDIIDSMDEFVSMMKRPAPKGKQDVYLARDGGYFITYNGGQVSYRLIKEALKQGIIEPTYKDCYECWRLKP